MSKTTSILVTVLLLATALVVTGQPAPLQPAVVVADGADQLSGARSSKLSLLVKNPNDGDALTTRPEIRGIAVHAPSGVELATAFGANTITSEAITYPRSAATVNQDAWQVEARAGVVYFNNSALGARAQSGQDAPRPAAGADTGIEEKDEARLNLTLARLKEVNAPVDDRWRLVLTDSSGAETTVNATTHRWTYAIDSLTVTSPPGAKTGNVTNGTTVTVRAAVRNVGTTASLVKLGAAAPAGTLGALTPTQRTVKPGETAFATFSFQATRPADPAATLRLTNATGGPVSGLATMALTLEEPPRFPSGLVKAHAFPLVVPQRDAPDPVTLRFNVTNAGEATALLATPRLFLTTPLDQSPLNEQFDVRLVARPAAIAGGEAGELVYTVDTSGRTTYAGDVAGRLEVPFEDANVANGTHAGAITFLASQRLFTVDEGPPLIESVRFRPNPVLVTTSTIPPVTLELTATDEGLAAPGLNITAEVFRLGSTESLASFVPSGTWEGALFKADIDLPAVLGLPPAEVPGIYLMAAHATDDAGGSTTGSGELAVEDDAPPEFAENTLTVRPARSLLYAGEGTRLNVTIDVADNLALASVDLILVRHLTTTLSTTETRTPLEPIDVDSSSSGTWRALAPIRPGTYDLQLVASDGHAETRLVRNAHVVVEDTEHPEVTTFAGNGKRDVAVNATTDLELSVVATDDDAVDLVRATFVRPLAPNLPERVIVLQRDRGAVWTATLEAPVDIGEGSHLVLLATRDPWGNWRNLSASEALRVTVDTEPPSAPTPTSPSDGTVVDARSVRFAWSASDDSASNVTYELVLTAPGLVERRSTVQRELSLELDEASWTWRVDAVDQAGNRASLGDRALVVDRSPPRLSTLPALPGPVGLFAGLRVVAEDVSLAQLSYAIDQGPLQPVAGGAGAVDLDGLTPGQHTLSLRAVDRAGHENATSLSFELDPTLPTTVLTSRTAFDGPARLTFQANDTGSGVARIWVQVGAEDPFSFPPGQGTTLEEEGAHVVSYWAEDRAGNVETPHTVVIRVDRVDPELGEPVIEDGLVKVAVTEDGPVNVTAVFKRGAEEVRVELNDEGRDGDESAGDRTFSARVPALERGDHTLTIEARDAAGNLATASVGHAQGGFPLVPALILVGLVAAAGVGAYVFLRRRW